MRTVHQLTVLTSLLGLVLSLYMGYTYVAEGQGLHPALVGVIDAFLILGAGWAMFQLGEGEC